MKPLRIEHDRPNCIGCSACVTVAPEFWEMTDPDGKSDLVQSERKMQGKMIIKEELDIDEKDYKKNLQAAEVCPVNVIHIIKKETNEKII